MKRPSEIRGRSDRALRAKRQLRGRRYSRAAEAAAAWADLRSLVQHPIMACKRATGARSLLQRAQDVTNSDWL